MDTSRYTFRISFQDGLVVTPYDLENPETLFWVRVHFNKTKTTGRLVWNHSAAGGKWIEEEFTNSEDFKIGWGDIHLKSGHFYGYYYKGLVPYEIEIRNADEDNALVFSESFDPRHRLVNFTLDSDNPETLHTWMCAIEKFKKETDCQISIKNDYLKENQKYDFVECYWGAEESFERYYAGFQIGRFGDENHPDLYRNPDGLKNKNDLEIIEDILYHYTKRI